MRVDRDKAPHRPWRWSQIPPAAVAPMKKFKLPVRAFLSMDRDFVYTTAGTIARNGWTMAPVTRFGRGAGTNATGGYLPPGGGGR